MAKVQPKVKKVKSLMELKNLARTNPDYAKLLCLASHNLGGPKEDIEKCYRWLEINASETNSEDGVVDEVNFCIPLL